MEYQAPQMDENFSLIIPTFKEANNIRELVHRIASVRFNVANFEVIIVDDNSQDGIAEVVEDLQLRFNWLKLIIRTQEKSLCGAVIHGMAHASHPIIMVMDADLSHPPEKLPQMLAAIRDPDTDMVIGSRYTDGGSVDAIWPLTRRVASKGAAAIARLLLGKMICDPLSGFIAIRKNKLLQGADLNPIGWKISLEMMIKCRCDVVKEIPIHFTERKAGQSKMNWHVLVTYLIHLKRLLVFKYFSP